MVTDSNDLSICKIVSTQLSLQISQHIYIIKPRHQIKNTNTISRRKSALQPPKPLMMLMQSGALEGKETINVNTESIRWKRRKEKKNEKEERKKES